MSERDARINNLLVWLRNPEWAPAGADLVADDIEQFKANVKLLTDAITTLLARDDVPEAARRGLWDAIYAVDQATTREPGTATLDTPVSEIAGEAVLISGAQAPTCTTGTGTVLPHYLARIVAIMREESRNWESWDATGDPEYWRERAAEHFRRYADWIETAATGTSEEQERVFGTTTGGGDSR